MSFLNSNHDRVMDILVVPLSLLAIILFGHYGIFFGHTFSTDGDSLLLSLIPSGNSLSLGWRPDVGLGKSVFYGDPAIWHIWSIYRWWAEFSSSDILIYSISILVLLWIACFAQYWLLRVVVPDLGRTVSLLLSAMLAFGSLRNEFYSQRFWIVLSIVIVPIALILYDFTKNPSLRHYFLYTLTLCFALFMGSVTSLYQGLIFSVAFFLILAYHKGFYKNPSELWIRLKFFILLNAASGVTMVLLGAWVFYGIFLEQMLVGYVRDPSYGSDSFFASLNLNYFINGLLGFAQAGIFSHWTANMGLGQALNLQGWNMVSPLFPIVLLLSLFYKSQNFWEFASKCIVFVGLIFHEFVRLCPGIVQGFQFILNFYPPIKFHPVIQVFEIVLIGILLHRIQTQSWSISLRGLKITRIAGVFLSTLYAGVLIVACLAVSRPQTLESILRSAYNWSAQFIHFPAEAEVWLTGLITANVRLFNETMGATDIIFYGLTFILIALFATPYWPKILRIARGRIFTILLLVNSLFLAWTVYPLNKETLIWDRQKKNGASLSEIFEPTDRIATLGSIGCRSHMNFADCAAKKYFKGEFGPRRYQVGYRDSPILNFSSIKSFTQKEVAAMMDAFMRREGNFEKGYRRNLQAFYYSSLSKLYDFSAVNYFLSLRKQPEHEQLELVHASKQFYLYRNLNAWPYYYFADRVELIESYDDLYDAAKGVAYLWRDHDSPVFPTKNKGSNGHVELKHFSFGEMEFQTTSEEGEVLVVSDAWHPYWKAEIDQDVVPVIKVNGVFKGVSIPPGNHRVRLFFDNTPYRPGIWISLITWVGFIASWLWIARKRKVLPIN